MEWRRSTPRKEERMNTGQRIRWEEDPEKFIRQAITQYVRESPANRRKLDGQKYWDAPLVGFASGEDPLFRQYKKIIGSFHCTPQEIFNRTFGLRKKSQPLSVISWVLPITEDTRRSNRKEIRFPSRLWAHTRDFGEQFNVKLRNHIVALLEKKGYRAVAPMNSPYWRQLRSPKVGWASTWSERHAAYACGLGTFSLNDGLITPKGIAMRLGSVVTDLPLTSTAKMYPHRRANCLYFFNRTCKICVDRCPAGAISSKGHDKDKCSKYLHVTVPAAKMEEYDVKILGCGLCQTKVPCEFEIPRLIQKAYKKASGEKIK